MVKKKIKTIRRTGKFDKVFDIKCQKNHNFFIGETEILTHNCDFMTPQGQAALRQVMEAFSQHCRFILTCNFVERIIDPIQSRCIHFDVHPPSEKQVAIRCAQILIEEKVEFDKNAVIQIVRNTYPDIRRAIGMLYSNTTNGKLVLSEQGRLTANYMDKILEVLKSPSNPKQMFVDIRQIIADSRVRTFDHLYRFLYDEIDTFAKTGQANIILAIAESQYRSASVVDKEIEVMSMFINIIGELQ